MGRLDKAAHTRGPGRPPPPTPHSTLLLLPAGESGLNVAGTAAPYPDGACQGTRACLARGGEAGDEAPLWGEAALEPRLTSPHGCPAWACKVGHKLPSCLLGERGWVGGWERGERKARRGQQTHPCISDMQLSDMHYYVTQGGPPFHTCTVGCLSCLVSIIC